MRKFFIWLAGLFLLAQIATAKPRKDTAQRSARDEVSFELVSGYLVIVDGNIGSLHGLKFLVDTGATHSAVSAKVAGQLGLQRWTGRVLNIDKVVKTDWATLPEVECGPLRATQVSVVVTDMGYFKPLGIHVDAVIGLDLLRLKSFSIDLADKKVRFGPIEAGRYSIAMLSDDVALKVEAEANGRLLHLILDSGAPGPMIYEERLENRAVEYSIEQEDYAYRIDGVLRMTRARVRRLQLGGRDIDQMVFLTPSPAKGTLDGIDGFLGLTALKARRINFDFDTNTLSWTN